MSCPTEIAKILLEILGTGILRIRSAAWSGAVERCALEADHIHNLPELLAHYSPDLLGFYWEVTRPSFLEQSAPESLAGFQALWDRLRSQVPGATS